MAHSVDPRPTHSVHLDIAPAKGSSDFHLESKISRTRQLRNLFPKAFANKCFNGTVPTEVKASTNAHWGVAD